MPSSEVLAQMLAEAQAAWPEVRLSPDQYARYVAERVSSGGDVGEALRRLHAADLYLACACVAGDRAAIAAFDRRYVGEVPALLAHVERSPDLVAETQQVLRQRLLLGGDGLLPRIAEYSGRGSLMSWLRVAALRTLSNLRRSAQGRVAQADAAPPEALSRNDPELAMMRARYGPAFEQALRDAFSGLAAPERTILRFHFLDGLSIDRMGALLKIHRATAARRVSAARERLVAETMHLLRERLQCTPAELESLLGLVRSQLEVSLHGLLREPDSKQ